MGQGGMHAAGGSASNGEKQMHVRKTLFYFTVFSLTVTHWLSGSVCMQAGLLVE